MLPSVLKSERAALVKKFAKHDKQIKLLFEAIQELLRPEKPPKRRQIGFSARGEDER